MVARQTVKNENDKRCLKPSYSTPWVCMWLAHGFLQGAFLRRLRKTTKVDSDMQARMLWKCVSGSISTLEGGGVDQGGFGRGERGEGSK